MNKTNEYRQRVKLSDLGRIATGTTPSKKNSTFYSDSGYPFIKPDVFSENKICLLSDANEYITESGLNSARCANRGDILVTCIGNIGKTGIVNTDTVCFNQQINSINPNEMVSARYLAYNLLFNKKRMQDIANAPIVPIFNKTNFSNFEINIHSSIDEQKKIVDKLDCAQKIISLKNNQLEKLDLLIKARFVEMFGEGYEKVRLGDYIATTSGGTPSKRKPEYYKNGSIPWLTSGEVNAGFIKSPKNFITELGIKNSSAKMIPKHSVVVAMYGATAGVCGILNYETSTNQAVCALLPNEYFNPIFLYYNLKLLTNFMISQARGGGQPNISQSIIKELFIIKAPKLQQNQFADFVTQVEKVKADVHKSLDKTQMLFDSLMQQYFG